MDVNLIITGVGGQGNVLASKVIGKAAVSKKLKVSIGETFGLSQRGGPVLSHIRLSEDKVYGPLIPKNQASIIVGIEPLESLRVAKEFASPDCVIIANSRPVFPVNVISGEDNYPDESLIKQSLNKHCKKLYWFDATSKSLDLGKSILLNVILLGALSSLANFPINQGDILQTLKTLLPESAHQLNQQALEWGVALVSNSNP